MDKKLIIVAVIAFVVGGGAGYALGKMGSASGAPSGQFAGQMGDRQAGTRTNNSGSEFISGDIIASDDSGITVQTRDGSSKIVLVGDSTSITKGAEGTKSDLETGKTVTVMGTTNSDGSVSATSVSLTTGQQGGPMMPVTQ